MSRAAATPQESHDARNPATNIPTPLDSLGVNVRAFALLVAETEILLAHAGLSPGLLAPGFIAYWLSQGKTPPQIRRIALGVHVDPDAHLGGTDV